MTDEVAKSQGVRLHRALQRRQLPGHRGAQAQVKMLTVNSAAIRKNHHHGDDALPTLRIYPDTGAGKFREVHRVEWEGASSMAFRHHNQGGSGVPGAATTEVAIFTSGWVRGFDRDGALVVALEPDACST